MMPANMHPPAARDQIKTQKRALLLLALVFIVHIVVALVTWKVSGPSVFFKADTGHYLEPAQALLHGSFSTAGSPELFRTPGYPLLLVPAVASAHVVMVALLENSLLAAFTAWLVWRVTAHLFPGAKAAWWAVLLYSVEPLGFLYSETIMSDTAFTAVLLLFVWLFLRFLDSPSYGRLALSAFALAGAAYVRPASTYLAFLLSALLLIFPRALSPRRRLARAVVFPVVFQLLLLPWVVRNALVADYAGFSSSGNWNLYFQSGAAIQAKLEHRSFAETHLAFGANNNEVYFQQHPEQRAWTQGRVVRAWGREGRKIVWAHWATYLPIHAKGMAIVTFEPGTTELLKLFRLYPETGGLLVRVHDQGFTQATLWLLRQYPVTIVVLPLLAAQMVLYYVLALVGLRRLPAAVKVTFIIMIVYFTVVSGMPAAVARYRVPFMPLLCVCAGGAIAQWRGTKAKAKDAGGNSACGSLGRASSSM